MYKKIKYNESIKCKCKNENLKDPPPKKRSNINRGTEQNNTLYPDCILFALLEGAISQSSKERKTCIYKNKVKYVERVGSDCKDEH